jgi:hypothetical protein
MSDQDTVTISKSIYEHLLHDSRWLECLEAAGVDNWDGYEYARQIYREDYGDAE